jgi:hypothetical protein
MRTGGYRLEESNRFKCPGALSVWYQYSDFKTPLIRKIFVEFITNLPFYDSSIHHESYFYTLFP